MRRVCAWCNKQMESLQTAEIVSVDFITHSICDSCADNLDFQMGVSLTRYLDSLKMPIIALDESGQIIVINNEARKRRDNKTVAATWEDKIFECAHARLPEGCKKAVHCSGCAIRFTTAEVYRTGTSQSNVPAFFNSCSADLTAKIDLLFSVDKIADIVFLRIARI